MDRTPFFRFIPALALLLGVIPTAFTQQLSSTSIFGGSGGGSFSDAQPPSGARVSAVRIRLGDRLDSVQMVYVLADGSTSEGARHGGSGGTLGVFTLDSDEYITGITGRYGETIDSIQVITNKRSSSLYGGGGGDRGYRIDVPGGNQAVGFTGRAGDLLDAIGLTYSSIPVRQRLGSRLGGLFPSGVTTTKATTGTAVAGGNGGAAFSDNEFPQGGRIAQVRVSAGERIDAIQIVYALADGRLFEGARHGGGGGNDSVFQLDSDEYIIGISGRCGDNIDSLQIVTNKRTSQLFGGRGGDRNYRVDVPAGNQAIGFMGRAGHALDAIGLNYSSATQMRFPTRRVRTRP